MYGSYWRHVVVLAAVMAGGGVFAQPPMSVDDAGTMDDGGKKVEAVWRKVGAVRAWEMTAGFSPAQHWEIGVAWDREKDLESHLQDRGALLVVKWVPVQTETGWSVGAFFDLGHRQWRSPATDEKDRYQSMSALGLATYRANGHVVHLNAGVARDTQSDENTVVWGLGYEYELSDTVALLAQYYGEERSSPTRGVGVRWTVADGMKVGVMVDRASGRDRETAVALSWAWEF
ncbi:hypothetical protein [Hydrogenophilus thiooxidans]|uniref:hypothetical protein n=1 Tax=Hydrogenophilus thiooxidans TaxID=2820326 RepID=UPI001C20FFBB|nr:hypothetical protein [Hydrogenophilus thiooxidans]